MKRKHAGGRVLPADWTEVIGEVQEVLTQAEKEAGEREKLLAGIMPSIPSAGKAAAWKQGLERFDQRLPVWASATVSKRRPATYMNVWPLLANTVIHLPGPGSPQFSMI